MSERDVIGVWAWAMPRGPSDMRSTSTVFTGVEGVFDLIRESGSTAFQWKAYRYVVKTMAGRAYVSGPIKSLDYGHHISTIPPWPVRSSPVTLPRST